MHAAKSNWLRYPQYKPTKGEGFYKIMTSDGQVKIIQFSKLTQWNPMYVGSFVDELVTGEKPNPLKPKPGLTTPGRKSLYREFMDAGNYAQFTDMENPAQSPLLSTLQKLTASLPDDSMMEDLDGAIKTAKHMFMSSNVESPSAKFEVDRLIQDILDIRTKLKRVQTSVDSIIKDISMKTKGSAGQQTQKSTQLTIISLIKHIYSMLDGLETVNITYPMSDTEEKILDTSERICPICQASIKGPLALLTHKKFYHSPINTPLFRGKYPQRQPMASELKDALDKSISIADAARVIGISYLTFRKWCQILIPIEYDEFKKTSRPFSKPRTAVRVNYPYYKKIIRILDGNEKPPSNWTKTKFQTLLLRDSFLEDRCAICGFAERRVTDYKVPLLLDVIDGVDRHWSRDNLRMLCYNCYFLNVRSLYGIEYRNITGQDMKQNTKHDVNQVHKLENDMTELYEIIWILAGLATAYFMYGDKKELPILKILGVTIFGWISLIVWSIARGKVKNPLHD